MHGVPCGPTIVTIHETAANLQWFQAEVKSTVSFSGDNSMKFPV